MEVDLHGLMPSTALKRVAQALHMARVKGATELFIITGRGLGNHAQEPVLREKVEKWLRGPEGRRAGAGTFERRNKGGALLVKVGTSNR
jgi:DNA-nicking Smr family endonuclease